MPGSTAVHFGFVTAGVLILWAITALLLSAGDEVTGAGTAFVVLFTMASVVATIGWVVPAYFIVRAIRRISDQL